jgi:hypothetical protein
VSKTTINANAQPLRTDAKIIKNIPGQGAALRSQQGRRDQPLWQEWYKVQADRADVDHTHATNLDAHTFVEAVEEGGLDTEPFHGLAADKASRGEDRWG